MKKWLLLFAGIATWFTGVAQVEICGSTQAQYEFINRTKQNVEAVNKGLVQLRGAVEYVPVKYHLVGEDDGDKRIFEEDVLDQHCTLNEHYEDQEIQFFLNDGFSYINSTTAYNNPTSFSAQIRFNSARDDNAMNIYIPENAGSTDDGLTTNGFYTPAGDYIVMRKNRIGLNISTLTHEVGHFFSLAHPFVGWEASETGWDPAVHGNPVMSTLSPGGIPNELVDGSNGDTAADMIADTPADYLFGFQTQNCNFTGGCRDRNGDLLDPMETNYMQWGYQGCRNEFTQGQKDVIRADLLNNSERNYLENNFSPESQVINDEPELDDPLSLSETGNQTDVTFSWTPVDGATMYMLQTARNPGYIADRRTFITSETEITIQDYNIGTRYFFRVRPFNEYYTCTGYVDDSFTAGENTTAIQPVEGLKSLIVAPNLTPQSTPVRLQWELDNPVIADISIINAYGQVVTTLGNRELNTGVNHLNLPVENLQAGLYFIRVSNSENQVSTRKLIITN